MPANDHPQALRFLESMALHGEREAGERFAAAHPLAKKAGARQQFDWARDLCAFLNETYDDETVRAIRMDCACGPAFGKGRIKALYREEPDPAAFAERVNALDYGFTLTWDGVSWCLVYPECYCACVKKIAEPLPRAWCDCTVGYPKRMFEDVFGRPVEAELLSSVKQGGDACRIRITLCGEES